MSRYTLEKGRPASTEGRLEKEIRVYDLLDQLGMEYWHTDHPDARANTMEDCLEIDAVLQATVCKNLFLTNRQHTKYYLLMMPGEKKFKTKELSKQINSARLSFGTPEEMEELIGCHPGSASVMGLMNDPDNRVQLLVDRDIENGEFIGVHPCINTSSLKLRTDELFNIFLPAVHHDKINVTLIGE
jgi:Ala-tRNA(Pro) deacylase